MDRRAAGALLALAACCATATAAPTSNHTALDLYDGPTEGCYYNFQHYGEGDRIMTNEPCLNCTCHNRMLMCYLRVCPFTKPIGQDCSVEKRADQCCPIVTCPDVPVDLLTSTSTTSPAEYGGTGVGKVDNYGCSINGKYFPEGAKVPPTPNKPCEHCYCIRNMTTCVMQECTLHVDGCTPIYHKDVCCPVRYFCDHPEDETLQLDDMTTTVRPTPGFLLTTTTTETPTTEIQTKRECIEDGQIYPDGALIKTEKPCVHCYCMKGDIVCVVQECGTPMENEGKNCTSMPPREGQCCPDTYICEGDEITTETPLEEVTTLLPSDSTTRRGSVERKEPGVTYTESTTNFETEGSGEEDLLSITESSDLPTSKVQTEDRFGVTDQVLLSAITTESPAYNVQEQATTEPEKGLTTIPSKISEDEHSEPSVLEYTTFKNEIITTESPISLVPETSTMSTDQKQGAEAPEITSSGELLEKATTIPNVQIEDESSQASPRDEDEVTTEEAIVTTLLDQSKTTPSNVISKQTSEPVLTEQTTLKSDSVTKEELTTSGPTETLPKDVYTEETVADFTEHSSEPSIKEKSTTIYNLGVTESSTTSKEKEITSTVLLEESKTQIPEVTESVVTVNEYTTHKEMTPEENSEPSLFDKNTSSDAVTESEEDRTKIPSIDEDDVTISSTPKVVEGVEKSTALTTAEEGKATTTENLVKETGTTPEPSHEQTLLPATASVEYPTTEQILEQNINEEKVSTLASSTEIVPQDEKQEITEANFITTLQPIDKIQPTETTTTLNPEDNEISEDILPPGRIPGEGDCLFNGVTYKNESSVPNINKCETSCKCVSSIIKCDPIICSPPPEYMANCQLVYDTSESCCPTYICEETKETIPPQSHSQMSGTESPTLSPPVQCNGDECKLSVEKQPTTVLPDLTKTPSNEDCGSEGCESQIPVQTNISEIQPAKCIDDKCTECVNGNCQLPPSPEIPQHIPSETIAQECQGSEECREDKTQVPLCEGQGCTSETPTLPEISTPCEGEDCISENPTLPDISTPCKGEGCTPVTPTLPEISTPCEGEGCISETPKLPESSTQCEGEGCISETPTLPEISIPCAGKDCISETPTLPELSTPCEGDDCLSKTPTLPELSTACEGEGCTLETPTLPEISIPCEGKDCISDTATLPEISIPCEGKDCISETPTLPKIPTPCKGGTCPELSQGCTSDKCIVSDNIPPKSPQESEICSDGKDCKPFEEKDCQDDSCRRNEDRIKPPSQPLPPRCIDQDCLQQESSPDKEVTSATTEQILLEVSTFSTLSYSTSVNDTTNEFPNIITDSITEKTTQSTAHQKEPESLNTETSEGAKTTQAPQVTEGLEGENTVPVEEITDAEKIHMEHSMSTTTELYNDKDVTTKIMETEREQTKSPAVTQNQEAFTSSPAESETQREDTSTQTPEPISGEPEIEKETEKSQTPLSELKPTQPPEPFTNAPVEQPEDSTGSKVYDEQTETSDQHLLSSSRPSTQDIFEFKTTPEYIGQSTILPESTEKVGEPESIPSPEDIELPEKSDEKEGTTLSPELEKKTTKLSFSDSEKEAPQKASTQPQEVAFTSTDEPITQEEIKTDAPTYFITDSSKPVKDHTGTETPISTNAILYDTELPIETMKGQKFTTEIPEMITKGTEQGDKFTTEIPEIITNGTESPTLEEQTKRFDSYPTTPQSIITEITENPEENITPEHEIQKQEQHPEMPITESSLTLDTEEPVKTVKPEILTETTVSHISEPTEPTILQESTSRKEGLTDRPMELGTELNIPVSITNEPSVDTKETEESQICDDETECKKAQVPQAEATPCEGDSCVVGKEGCESKECTQSSTPTKITPTHICEEEEGCKKPLYEKCTDENCRKSEIYDSDRDGTPISDTDSTTKFPDKLEEEMHTAIPFEPHITETEAPATEEVPLSTDKTTKEPIGEKPEKESTELPEFLITSAPLATESPKYDTSKQTDVTQPEESITPTYEITTKGTQELETEYPSSQYTIPQLEIITKAPQEQFPTTEQEEVTESLVAVTGVNEPSTIVSELPKSTERGDSNTEASKIISPEENELTVKPDMDETLLPEQQEPEVPQPEVTTTGYSKVTSIPAQDHDLKDEERKTERPETLFTIPDLSVREPETTVRQQSDDEIPETTVGHITEIPEITEKTTEAKQEFSETTPFLVELEEHTHKLEESITTLLPSEEAITQEPTDIQDTEKDQVFEMSTQKPPQTESTLQYTEKPSEDGIPSETIRPDLSTTTSEEILEKITEPSTSEKTSPEPSKSTSSDIQVPDSRFTTESNDQENEISTVASTHPETKQTTHYPSEAEKPKTPIEDNMLQTIHDTLSSTAGTFETTASEEDFMQVTTKPTTPKTDENIATHSLTASDKYTKPETSTDIYPSTHAADTQKPVFGDMPPTEEGPQPEEESHFPPSGSYEPEPDYAEEEQFGPGTCRYGGKVYVSAQQIPRDDPCDFCFCFRSDIICLQQSCPPPIHGCHEEPIQGFCCPRYECPVSMATTLNVTTTTTTTTTTLPPHFLPHAYKGAAQRKGCQIKGHIYKVGEVVRASSGPCLHCTCGGDGQMKCDPKVCTPEPMLRQMIAAAVSTKRRR